MDNELLIAIENLLDRKLDEKLGRIDHRMDRFEERMDRFEVKLDKLETNVEYLNDKVDNLEVNVGKLNEQVSSMDVRLKCVELTLENEVRPNIMRVAEGHLDLNRKLDQVLAPDSEREILTVKVNYLDSEVRKLKEWKTATV